MVIICIVETFLLFYRITMKTYGEECKTMEIDLFWIGAGLAALGYFIGDGLKGFNQPKDSSAKQPTLIKEKDMHSYLGLSKEELKDLVNKYPNAPRIELNGTTYYNYQHFLNWMSSIDTRPN
jgi:hypothetical protein